VETAIYIAEIADKVGQGWIESDLRAANVGSNSTLFRIAFKMATGSGKTVVMAMLIAWQALNK
jgi:type III restriction enzyme